MKLYYMPGACSLASRITMNEIGLSFDSEAVNAAEGKTASGADYKTINPRGYVPALEIEPNVVLTENPAILQYIAGLKPGSNLAPAPATLERARLQESLNFTASELHKAFTPFFKFKDMDDKTRTEYTKAVNAKIAHIESSLSDGRDYLLGSDFTVADAYALVVLNWSNFIKLDLSAYPKVQAYLQRGFSRPAVLLSLKQEGLAE